MDAQKWDALVMSHPCQYLYGISKYLDVVCGSKWGVLFNSSETSGVVIATQKRMGIQTAIQPPFVQICGPFGQPLNGDETESLLLFLKKKFARFSLAFQSNINFPDSQLITEDRKNYTLELNSNYARLNQGYSQNLKRILKKRKEIKPGTPLDWSDFQSFAKKNFPPIQLGLISHSLFTKYVTKMKEWGKARLSVLRNDQGQLISALFYLIHENRIYLIAPISNREGRKQNAMHHLIDSIISDSADSDLILDFEGSSISGVARFYANFGSQCTPYTLITKPFISSQIERGLKKLRSVWRK